MRAEVSDFRRGGRGQTEAFSFSAFDMSEDEKPMNVPSSPRFSRLSPRFSLSPHSPRIPPTSAETYVSFARIPPRQDPRMLLRLSSTGNPQFSQEAGKLVIDTTILGGEESLQIRNVNLCAVGGTSNGQERG